LYRLLIASLVPISRRRSHRPSRAYPDCADLSAGASLIAARQHAGLHSAADKLAKAITLGHISTALDIIGSLWGHGRPLASAGLALGRRFAAWAESVSRRRWLQDCLLFAVFLFITTLAGLRWMRWTRGQPSLRHQRASWGSWA